MNTFKTALCLLIVILFRTKLLAGDTITGYFDNDSMKDVLIYNSQPAESSGVAAYIEVVLSKKTNPQCTLSFNYKTTESQLNISNYNVGGICIATGNFIGSAPEYRNYYKFNPVKKHWYREKSLLVQREMTPYGAGFPSAEFRFFDGTECIDGTRIGKNESTLPDIQRRKQSNRARFDSLYNRALIKYRTNTLKELNPDDFELPDIVEIVHSFPLSRENESKYNDLGFFYSKINGALRTAGYLLWQVIKADTARTVAYLNLGDAYWDIKNEAMAGENYKIYIDKMKAMKKEKQIPTRAIARSR
jgi:hypothetical protein